MPPLFEKGLENEVPGRGAVAIALSSNNLTRRRLTHKYIGNTLLVNFKIVYEAFFGECFALEQPGSLIVGILVEKLVANVNALVEFLSVKS
jgi:hypothetical protein